MENYIQLTMQQFTLIAPRVPVRDREEILRYLNEALIRYNIGKNIYRVAAFISNLCHESLQFKYKGEIWGPTAAQLRYEPKFGADGKMLPGAINRKARDLGNTQKGDGKKRRGWGWIQTTGGKNQRRVFRLLGMDAESDPSLLGEPRYAAFAAGIFWSDNSINELADCLTGKKDANETKTLTAICRRINGGTNGLDDRIRYYWRAVSVLRNSPVSRVAAKRLAEGVVANSAVPEIANSIEAAQLHPAVPPVPENAPVAAQADAPVVPELSKESEKAVVAEQRKASELIDLAEQTPASSLRAAKNNIGTQIVGWFAYFGTLLEAGNYGAWAVVIVLAAALIYLIYTQRGNFRRWATLAKHWAKDLITTE